MFDIEILKEDPPCWTRYNYVFKKIENVFDTKIKMLDLDKPFCETTSKYYEGLRHYRAYALENSNLYFGWTTTRNCSQFEKSTGGWYLAEEAGGKYRVLCQAEVNSHRLFKNVIKDILIKSRIKARAQILYYVLKNGIEKKNNENIYCNDYYAKKQKAFKLPNHPLILFKDDCAFQPSCLYFKNPFYLNYSSHEQFKYIEILDYLEFHHTHNWQKNSSEIKLKF